MNVKIALSKGFAVFILGVVQRLKASCFLENGIKHAFKSMVLN